MGKKKTGETPTADQHTRYLCEQYDKELRERSARLAAELAYRQQLLLELGA